MEKSAEIVVFNLDDQRYALRLSAVDRVFRMVEITPLPSAPEIVLGVVNVQGGIIPVINLRRRFRLPEGEINLSDQLIIARTSTKTVALVVDSVSNVIEVSGEQLIKAEKIVPGLDYLEAVVKLDDDLVLIHHLEKLLSLEEQEMTAEALGSHEAPGS